MEVNIDWILHWLFSDLRNIPKLNDSNDVSDGVTTLIDWRLQSELIVTNESESDETR